MSEIPEEIIQAAREAYHSAFNEFGNAKDVDVYAAIARAILAERQRCAEIARGIASDLRNGDTNRFTAAKIAGAIMSTPKGGEA